MFGATNPADCTDTTLLKSRRPERNSRFMGVSQAGTMTTRRTLGILTARPTKGSIQNCTISRSMCFHERPETGRRRVRGRGAVLAGYDDGRTHTPKQEETTDARRKLTPETAPQSPDFNSKGYLETPGSISCLRSLPDPTKRRCDPSGTADAAGEFPSVSHAAAGTAERMAVLRRRSPAADRVWARPRSIAREGCPPRPATRNPLHRRAAARCGLWPKPLRW